MKRDMRCTINGRRIAFSADPGSTVLDILRDVLHLLGTKEGCGTGDCGACTVLLNDRPVTACLVWDMVRSSRGIQSNRMS